MTEHECDMLMTLQWPAVVRWAKRQEEAWIKGFALSIAGKGKRKDWLPSPKQERLMRRLIDAQRADDQALLNGEGLIERD